MQVVFAAISCAIAVSIDFSAVYERFSQSVDAGRGVNADFCRLVAGVVRLFYFFGFTH